MQDRNLTNYRRVRKTEKLIPEGEARFPTAGRVKISEWLFLAHGPLWRYSLIEFVLALFLSILTLSIATGIFLIFGADIDLLSPPKRPASWREAFGLIVFAPILETLLLAAMLRVLSAATNRKLFIATTSAVLWGCLHGAFGLLWFFGTVWSFFIFSCAYIAWRKVSFRHAFMAAAVPHALVNTSAMLVIVFGQA